MTKQELALSFAQKFDTKSVYTTKEAISLVHSKDRVYRHLKILKSLGIVQVARGYFTMNTTLISQPLHLIEKILPSLESLKRARTFGRYYGESDIEFVRDNLRPKLITLDYKSWELTNFQHPSDFYIYVENVEQTVNYLKENKFHEGEKGRVRILPIIGDFSNEIQRVYFDCLAKGGRSIQDAVAIELLYSNRLVFKANFPTELIQKVQDDLPER
jgi:hypothetical protein